MKLGNGKI